MAVCVFVYAASALSQKDAPADADAGAPAAADDARRTRVVAEYDGGAITVGQLEDAAARAPAHLRARYRDPEHLKTLLAVELREALLAAEARRRGYARHPAVLRATKEAAVRSLHEARTREALRADEAQVEAAGRGQRVQAHGPAAPERRRASHIAVSDRDEASALLVRARTMDRKAFRELARELSSDAQTRAVGGDLGYFDVRGNKEGAPAVPKSITKAVFSLDEVGAVAPQPVRTDAGFSVVMLTGVSVPAKQSPEQLRADMHARIAEDGERDVGALVEQLRREYAVETHPELLGAIRLDEPARAEPAAPAQTHVHQ